MAAAVSAGLASASARITSVLAASVKTGASVSIASVFVASVGAAVLEAVKNFRVVGAFSVVDAGVVISYAGSHPAFRGSMHLRWVGLKCCPNLQVNLAENQKLHLEYIVQSLGSGTSCEFIVASGGQSGLPGPKLKGFA